MNRQLFLQLLEQPDSVSESAGIELKKFTEDFPYCQTGQLLFVKHLHSQSSVHYPERLKLAAAYSTDRKVLYQLIHSTAVEQKTAAAETPYSQPLFLGRRERVPDKLAENPAPEMIQEETKIVPASKDKIDVIEKRLQEISSLRKTEIIPEEKKVKVQQEPEFLSVKKEIVPEQEIISQQTGTESPVITAEKKELDLSSGKHSFTAWLKTIKKEPVKKTKEAEKKAKPDSAQEEIINRFIETEPRIVPSKAQFYSPIKMAKQSLEEHDDLVSETLAGIFAQQGNLPKAIEMYKKLILLNPEKSAFFATLIEKLTNQLNTGK